MQPGGHRFDPGQLHQDSWRGMGKGRDKRKRNARKFYGRTREEEEIVRAFEAEHAAFEAKHARISGKYMPKRSERPPSDSPILGEPGAPVRAPLKPRPNLRSGEIAMPEPESENEFMLLKPRSY